jgi:hypothetical protein
MSTTPKRPRGRPPGVKNATRVPKGNTPIVTTLDEGMFLLARWASKAQNVSLAQFAREAIVHSISRHIASTNDERE